jgi:hypothetical protein
MMTMPAALGLGILKAYVTRVTGSNHVMIVRYKPDKGRHFSVLFSTTITITTPLLLRHLHHLPKLLNTMTNSLKNAEREVRDWGMSVRPTD